MTKISIKLQKKWLKKKNSLLELTSCYVTLWWRHITWHCGDVISRDTVMTSYHVTLWWLAAGCQICPKSSQLDETKCTEIDLKKSRICPILGQSDPLWGQIWQPWLTDRFSRWVLGSRSNEGECHVPSTFTFTFSQNHQVNDHIWRWCIKITLIIIYN